MESPFLAFCSDDIAAVEIEDGWKVSPQRYMTECKVYEIKISEKPRAGERTKSRSVQDDQKAMKTDKSTGKEKGTGFSGTYCTCSNSWETVPD